MEITPVFLYIENITFRNPSGAVPVNNVFLKTIPDKRVSRIYKEA